MYGLWVNLIQRAEPHRGGVAGARLPSAKRPEVAQTQRKGCHFRVS
jgi:hypothetical protein